MSLSSKFVVALMAVMILAVPGMVVAQNPDLSQNPSPDSMTNDQTTGQMSPDQAPADQGYSSSSQEQDSVMGSNDSMNQGDNTRPPMSEQPPKPSPTYRYPNSSGPSSSYPNSSYPNDNNSENTNAGVARISLVKGNVSTQRGDTGDWSAAQLNAPLVTGDRISTGDSARTELQLDYANILRLSDHTQANITNLTRSNIQIQLGSGMANYTVLRDSDAIAEISTPNVSIRTERRAASFRILVSADDHTEVLVRHGEVEIATPQGGTRVGENQFIVVRGNGDQTQYRIGEAPARDDWDQWNTDRDRIIRSSVSRRHTNDYYVGSEDLDAYGSWRDVPDYGNVWFPNEGSDWAPYRAGNWVWEPYWGWTWVSYDPWGWAPYHYGRWFLYNGAWGWWPGPVYPYYQPIWAPAYVSFFGFGGGWGFGYGWGSVGWFPIGPCDYFYPWWGPYRHRFTVTSINRINMYPHPYRTGWGGIGPLHRGNMYSNARLAWSDPHFRGASSIRSGEFGRGHVNFQPVNHELMTNARFATGNLPLVPGREHLSASGRPAAADTLRNVGRSQHFFSQRGTTEMPRRSFAQEQAQLSNAMRQGGVSPVNNPRGFESRNNEARSNARLSDNNLRPGLRTESPAGAPPSRSGGGTNESFRSFHPLNEQNSRPPVENRGNTNWGSSPRPGGTANPGPSRESGNSGGWQRFTPMQPRTAQPEPQGRSYGGGAENRGSYNTPRYPSSGNRVYPPARPQLNMRQPIVTPRSYRDNPSYGGSRSEPAYSRPAPSYGGRPGYQAPSYGGRAPNSGPSYGGGRPSYSAPSGGGRPSYGGGGRSAPSGGGHSAPSGGSHGGGSAPSHGGRH